MAKENKVVAKGKKVVLVRQDQPDQVLRVKRERRPRSKPVRLTPKVPKIL